MKWQFVPPDKNRINLIIARFESTLQRENVQRIINRGCKGLEVIDEKDITDIDNLLQKQKYQQVYDCVPEHFETRRKFYEKYDLPYFQIGYPTIAYRPNDEDIRNISARFRSIGILKAESERVQSKFYPKSCVQVWEGDFQWRKDKNCFEYLGKLDYIPEILFVSFCFLNNPVVLYEV